MEPKCENKQRDEEGREGSDNCILQLGELFGVEARDDGSGGLSGAESSRGAGEMPQDAIST